MNNFILSCVICICVIGFVTSDDHGEYVVSFTKTSFSEAIDNQEILFVMFYAPWCGHCKRLAPTWDDLAKEFNVEGRKLTIGKVDCTTETDLCSTHLVRGYPTVKYFSRSNIGIKYGNERSIDAFKSFIADALSKSESLDMKNLQQPPAEQKEDAKEPEIVVTDGLYDLSDETFSSHVAKGHHFIKFFAPWCGHCKRMAPTWEELASQYIDSDKVKVGKVDCTLNRKTCSHFGVRGYPTILWITNGERSEDYRGQRTIEELTKFVTKMTSVESETAKTSNDGTVPDVLKDEPEVGVVALTDEDFEETVTEDFTFAIFDNDVKRIEAVMPTLKKLAERYVNKPQLLVATIDCTKNENTCKGLDQSLPQYKLYYKAASLVTYNGEKTVVAMETYINEMMKKYGDDVHDEL